MGTFGTGLFGSDGALDLLDELVDQPAVQRREALERVFSRLRDRPDLLGRKIFPDEIVAAAAVVAAGLPSGESIRDGPRHDGWTGPQTAAEARQTTDRLTAILLPIATLGQLLHPEPQHPNVIIGDALGLRA